MTGQILSFSFNSFLIHSTCGCIFLHYKSFAFLWRRTLTWSYILKLVWGWGLTPVRCTHTHEVHAYAHTYMHIHRRALELFGINFVYFFWYLLPISRYKGRQQTWIMVKFQCKTWRFDYVTRLCPLHHPTLMF